MGFCNSLELLRVYGFLSWPASKWINLNKPLVYSKNSLPKVHLQIHSQMLLYVPSYTSVEWESHLDTINLSKKLRSYNPKNISGTAPSGRGYGFLIHSRTYSHCDGTQENGAIKNSHKNFPEDQHRATPLRTHQAQKASLV